MTSVRRSKAMPTDGPTAKFLYIIIKQLDLKCIDWNLVASQLEISNGHAARMRYSRFRQQMEGITSTTRGPRAKKGTSKSAKGTAGPRKGDQQKDVSPPPQQMIKHEPPVPSCELSPYVKSEPYGGPIPNLAEIPYSSTHIASPTHHHDSIPYSPVTMASAELGIYSHAPSFAPVSVPYDHHPHRLIWEPVKAEPQPEPEHVDRELGASVKMELTLEEREVSEGR